MNRRFDVREAHGALTSCRPELDSLFRGENRLAAVIDAGVARAWPGLVEALQADDRVKVLVQSGGERAKSWSSLRRLLESLDELRIRRRDEPVVAIGGGAVLDLVSLAASLFRRGVPFWRVPTTPLAAMDAAVGLKTSINFFGRKNLVGGFSVPEHVVVDSSIFSTVPLKHVRSSAAEVVKVGLAVDRRLFAIMASAGPEIVRNKYQDERGRDVVTSMAAIMSECISSDPFEANLVNPTDLGHSFSRGFEQLLTPRPSHGDAVSIDIALSATLSRIHGLLDDSTWSRICATLLSCGLPLDHSSLDQAVLERSWGDIVTHRDGQPQLPLLADIGQTEIVALDDRTLRRLLDEHRALTSRHL